MWVGGNHQTISMVQIWHGAVAQLVERQVQHAADAASTPQCTKGLFLQSTFRQDFLTVPVQPPCAMAFINICEHTNDPKHRQPYHCLDKETTAHTKSTLEDGMWLSQRQGH